MADTSYIISGGFFDSVDSDRLYSADDMNMPYKDLVNDGIYKESDGTTPGFAVTASGSMNVLVAPGRALIGGKWGANKEIQTIEIAGNTGGTARIDSIVLQCDTNLDVRAVQLVYRQGGASAPELLTSDGITEFRLANIRVAASASAISSGDITDTRGGTECPWVTSVFDPPDADYILTEYRTDLAGENRTVKAAIDSLQNAAQTGQPAVANQAADMRDTSLVYLYEGSEEGYDAGYLYHYSAVSDQWVRGAQYGASTVDTALSDSSTNAVQNRVVKAAVDQLTDDVAGLNGRLDQLDGVGDAFDVETHVSENLLNVSEIETGCYYWTNGKNTNASYNSTPLIPVTPGQTLWFQYGNENAASRQKGSIRFAVGYNADGNYVSGSEKGTVASYTVPNGVSYVRFSINFNTLTEAQKPVIIAQDEDVVRDYIPYFAPYTSVILKSESDSDQTRQNTADIEELRQQISVANGGKAIFSVKAATVNANANLICCDRCDNKKNEYIELTANFATFGNLTIAHGKDAFMGGYITITSEKILVYSYNGTLYEEFTHGLTLSDFINVIIYTKNINTCRSSISIMSSGGDYTAETTRYYSCRAAVLCNADFAMTNVEMRYTVNDAAEDVWVFGDSYLSLGDPNRWANQMMLAGHKNVLLCGYGGAKSVNEILSFRNLIAVAKPQYVVWTLGMNDGDSSTAINAEWKTYVDEVIATCENNGVVPILATIPNVPNIIHTFKNTYVRESGKRYVDFAKAVNAESAGASWYTGMLSSDNTHPTALGAKALMRRFLLDVPEVLYAEE